MTNIKDYPEDAQTDKLEEFVNEVIRITNGKHNNIFRNQAVLKAMDHALSKGNYQKVIEYSKNLNPNVLSSKDFNGESKDGKKFTKPSDKESFFLKLTKALDRVEKFQECIDMCDIALGNFPDVFWFNWRKGSALRKLKNYSEAIKLLEDVILKKKDWFIYKDLSAAYLESNDYTKAFEHFLEGAFISINIPEPHNRWELYYIGAKILYELVRDDDADKHIALVAKLREENQWQLQDFLQHDLSSRNIKLDKSSSDLFKELKTFWIAEKSKSLPQKKGEIKNLIQEGKSGFIKSDGGKDYYFRSSNFLDKKLLLTPGKKVQFNTQKSFDKRKNRESEEAINIKCI